MPRELSFQTKEKLVKKLNKAFGWELIASEIEIHCYSTSGAFKWVSRNLTPQICCEDRVGDILKSKHLSFMNGGYRSEKQVHVSTENEPQQHKINTSTPIFTFIA